MTTFMKMIFDYNNRNSLGNRFRQRRAVQIRELITRLNESKGSVRILDIGGTLSYWSIFDRSFLQAMNVSITLLNLEGQDRIIDDQIFKSHTGNGCHMPEFPDRSFDLVHSNSVIEHVGTWSNMVQFAQEVKRVGQSYYIQTPNYWFPYEPHFHFPFFQWLPLPIKLRLILRFELGFMPRAKNLDEAMRICESTNLLNKSMLACLFPNATILREKLLFLTKSFMAVR